MAGRLLPIESVDDHLRKLLDKRFPEGFRDLVQPEDGDLGPLAKMVVIYRVLNERKRLSATDMAAKLWNALSVSQQALFINGKADGKTFENRMRRWFQPSQVPYTDLNETQARALEEAATKIAEQTLGVEAGIRQLLRRPWKNAMRLASALMNNKSDHPKAKIDRKLQLGQQLLHPDHEDVVQLIISYLANKPGDIDFLCIGGEPYSGQENILSCAIERYREGDHLPIFAQWCGGLTYSQVGVEVATFLEERSGFQGEPDAIDNKLNLIRDRAESLPAVYIFVDLELRTNPARRLVRQEDIIELIDVLSHSNPQTRVIISCEEPTDPLHGDVGRSAASTEPTAAFTPQRVNLGWAETKMYALAPPTTQSLFRALGPLVKVDALSGLQQSFPDERIDGVALDLCAVLLRLCAAKGVPELEQGARHVETLLRSANNDKSKLKPVPVFNKLWEALSPLQKKLCVTIAASEDGVRESSLALVLQDLQSPPPDDERNAALKELESAFGETLRHNSQQWVLDDLPGGKDGESHFEFHPLIRRAILTAVEDRPEEEDLARRVHRSIAKRAREQAYHRRLNASGVYGTKLQDLLRDIQALLSLVASVNLQAKDVAVARGGIPLEVERAVFQGTDGRTTLRFAFLQMWQQDIDRDYRLNTVHAADELRLHVLLAIATCPGKSFFPSQNYQVRLADFDALRNVFSGDELLELLTSLAIAAHQTGAFNIVDVVAHYAEITFENPEQAILRTKLRRAYIDTLMLDSDQTLGQIEGDLRKLLSSMQGDSRAEKQARLKLYLRLGDICYLQGTEKAENERDKRQDAKEAFEKAISLEQELAGGESCPAGRAFISGLGARRFLRAELNWAMAEVREAMVERRKCDWQLVRKHIERARDIHRISLRRLSRHAADRAGILLDEARLQFVEGYTREGELGRKTENDYYSRVKYLIARAHVFLIQPGLPIATKLDLDGLVVRIGIELAESRRLDEDMLRRCESSLERLQRVARSCELPIYKAYSLLLNFKFRFACDGDRVYKDGTLVEGLKKAMEICEKMDLGIYKSEIRAALADARFSMPAAAPG